MGILETALIKVDDSENKCRAILSACEDSTIVFPSCAEEYDIAAFLYNYFSNEDDSYPQKAYQYALLAITAGNHTSQNLGIVADYLFLKKNLNGLEQLNKLVHSFSFCFNHTPSAWMIQNKIEKSIKELSNTYLFPDFILFTEEEMNEIFSICKHHRDIISTWEMYKKMEEDGMKHAYWGVRTARAQLYQLDYEEINIDYPGATRSYYNELKTSLIWSNKLRKYRKSCD